MSDLAERIREIVKAYSEPAVRSFEAVATDCCHVLIYNAPTILAGLAAIEERDKPSATEELQSWLYEEKSHSARITHDNGYGATVGWEVELTFGVHSVRAFEYASNNHYRDTDPIKVTTEQEWPGLDWTIRKAIELARAALQPTPEPKPNTE